jgi:hypothetical protein
MVVAFSYTWDMFLYSIFFHIVTRLVFSSSYGCNKTIKLVVLDVIYYIYDVVFKHDFFIILYKGIY